MNYTGNNYLSLNYSTGLSFNVNVALDNLSGICNLGFTGVDNFFSSPVNINFKFDKGKIFDPQNRLVSFYKENENINIIGNITKDQYLYYINNNLLCLNGQTNAFTFSGYYINLSGCQAESTIEISGKKPFYYMDIVNKSFNIEKSNYITGLVYNYYYLQNFQIYSGSITLPTGFEISGLPLSIDSNYNTFKINHYPITSGQSSNFQEYEIQLDLFTNFGKITKNYTVTGTYPDNLNFSLNFIDVTDFYARTGLQNILGDYKNNDYTLEYIYSTGTSAQSYNLNKYINVELSYYGGKTGEITGNIIGSGYKNLTLTGLLSGSGYIFNTGYFTATGYHGLSGVQITGNIAGSTNLFTYATGYFPYNLNLVSTGYQLGSPLTGYKNYEFTGFTSTGIIEYNANISNIFYHKLAELSNFGTLSTIPKYSLRSNSSGTIFGVTINGETNSNFSTGKVYIYTGNQINYSLAKTYSGIRGDRFFGTDLFIADNNKIFISTSGVSGLNNPSGRVYVLDNYNQNLDSNTFKLENTGAFGMSLAVNSGNILFVGAIFDNPVIGAGAVYVYTGENNWILKNKLTGMYNFGRAIETNLSGDVALIGSWGNSGEISVFTGDINNDYNLSSKLDKSNLFHGTADLFGYANPSLNRDGTVAVVPAYGRDILYIYTGNKNVYAQTTFISGNQNSSFGQNASLNRSGTSFAVNDNNTIDIYSGSNDSWSRTKEITNQLINDSLSVQYGLKFVNYDNINLIFTHSQSFTRNLVINDINFSGYIGQLIATGIIKNNDNYILTGLITGQKYTKSFFDAFNIITGYYLSGFITGLTDFKIQNKIQGNKYYSTGLINSGIDKLFFEIKTRNYFDNQRITGKLTLSGYNLDQNKTGIVLQYITGIN